MYHKNRSKIIIPEEKFWQSFPRNYRIGKNKSIFFLVGVADDGSLKIRKKGKKTITNYSKSWFKYDEYLKNHNPSAL